MSRQAPPAAIVDGSSRMQGYEPCLSPVPSPRARRSAGGQRGGRKSDLPLQRISRGELPTIKLGKRRLVRVEALRSWLDLRDSGGLTRPCLERAAPPGPGTAPRCPLGWADTAIVARVRSARTTGIGGGSTRRGQQLRAGRLALLAGSPRTGGPRAASMWPATRDRTGATRRSSRSASPTAPGAATGPGRLHAPRPQG